LPTVPPTIGKHAAAPAPFQVRNHLEGGMRVLMITAVGQDEYWRAAKLPPVFAY
jgi:hypothetical protein